MPKAQTTNFNTGSVLIKSRPMRTEVVPRPTEARPKKITAKLRKVSRGKQKVRSAAAPTMESPLPSVSSTNSFSAQPQALDAADEKTSSAVEKKEPLAARSETQSSPSSLPDKAGRKSMDNVSNRNLGKPVKGSQLRHNQIKAIESSRPNSNRSLKSTRAAAGATSAGQAEHQVRSL
ncbi:hypothetical protein EJ08DRAFT_187723 [Tothia fuscella]|uniref:Uncharacterized protein n=1 Tax=Tothia fuscella TaxID=1048955 RepID=A0A9P4U005_9PEZI|nr:hypothetical protein EJ08DRAFT_187723 [Tothia fuscella]